MTAAPAASALREQVARALAQCHGDQWAESEGEPVEGYGERFAFAWQAEADKCIALIRPAVLRDVATLAEDTAASSADGIGTPTIALEALAAVLRKQADALASAAEAHHAEGEGEE